MALLRDSSEIEEAAGIFGELVSRSAVVARKDVHGRLSGKSRSAPRAYRAPRIAPRPEPIRAYERTGFESPFRGDKLENVLYAMCRRGGFSGAVIVDADGFSLAACDCPVDEQSAAACAVVLGQALEKGAALLKQTDANNISIDIDYVEKAVVRRFYLNDSACYLMVVCPQDIDERPEIELSIDKVISILKNR